MVRYPTLVGEMAKREITKKAIARELGVSERTIHSKFSGGVSFSWEEVLTIKNCFFPDMDPQDLFAQKGQDTA